MSHRISPSTRVRWFRPFLEILEKRILLSNSVYINALTSFDSSLQNSIGQVLSLPHVVNNDVAAAQAAPGNKGALVNLVLDSYRLIQQADILIPEVSFFNTLVDFGEAAGLVTGSSDTQFFNSVVAEDNSQLSFIQGDAAAAEANIFAALSVLFTGGSGAFQTLATQPTSPTQPSGSGGVNNPPAPSSPTIDQISDSGEVVNHNITLTGHVVSGNGTVTALQAQVDSAPAVNMPFDSTGAFSFTTSLALNGSDDGSHTVYLRAINQAGNVSNPSQFTFVLDTTPPVVTFTSPSPGAVVNTNPTVTGTVSAPLSGVASLQAQVDSGTPFAVAVGSSGAFSFTTSLALNGSDDGPHTVHLIATDKAGNVSQPFNLTFTLATIIADPNLEVAVQQALALPAGQGVTKANLLNLTILTADNNVSSLEGLQFATNLQTLTLQPSDPAAPDHITDLSPLSGLTKLQTLALDDSGITNGELTALSGLTSLQSLDLRNNSITDISAVAKLPSLANLQLYGNPITDLSPLAGKVINIDLAPNNPQSAQTVAELAKALYDLPLEMYQYVVNNFTNQLYPGLLKGSQATLETQAGNDWDQDNLLAELLKDAGVQTRFVSGTIEAPAATVENWLQVTTDTGADDVLYNEGLNPSIVTVNGSSGSTEEIQFEHTWLEAFLAPPGGTAQWVDLDPTWKFSAWAAPFANLLQDVPFDATGYLSQVRQETPVEYYEGQVSQYLATNDPAISLADVAHAGPIYQQTITALPTALPYTVVGSTTISAQVPENMQWNVTVTLSQGTTNLIQQSLVLPDMSQEPVTVDYISAGSGMLTPELLLNRQVVAQGSAVADASTVQVAIAPDQPGAGTQTFTVTRQAGQVFAIGLYALQISGQMLDRLQNAVNATAIATQDGTQTDPNAEVNAELALAIYRYYYEMYQGIDTINRLTGAVDVFGRNLTTGLTTADSTVDYHTDLPNPAIPNGVAFIDGRNLGNLIVPINGDDSDSIIGSPRLHLADYNDSFEENAIWEEIFDTPGISTVKSFQIANQDNIPILTITPANESTLLPELTVDAATIADVKNWLAQGMTVIIPRDPTPLDGWTGVAFETIPSSVSYGYGTSNGGYFIGTAGIEAEGGYLTLDGPSTYAEIAADADTTQSTVGDPVNIANGDVTRDETDVTIPGIGLSLTFARHYDSGLTSDIGMGTGWTYSYSDHLVFYSDGSIGWMTGQGVLHTFTPKGSGGYNVPTTIFGSFNATSSGYTYRSPQGLEYLFDTTGRLQKIVDANGNALVMSYNGNGQLSSVTEADDPAAMLTFTYTGGHITGVSDGNGRTWTYSYSGNLLTEASAPSDANTPAATVQYAYYTDKTLNGLLHTVTEPNGGVTTFTYYSDKRAFQVTDPEGNINTYTYNLYRSLTYFTDARGNTTVYGFNSVGNLISQTNPDGSTESFVWQNNLLMSSKDEMGETVTNQYDAEGNLIQTTDAAGNKTSMIYDPTFNKVLTITQPGGRVTTYTYDSHGNETSVTDRMGNVTTMSYNTLGLMTTEVSPRGNQSTTPALYTTTYTYNDVGEVLTITTVLGSAETFTYDSRGNKTSVTDPDGNTTQYSYDLLGRLLSTTDALSGSSSNTYDAMSNLVSTTDVLGRTTKYVYNLNQQLIETINPDGTTLTDQYDPAGNLIAQRDQLGRVKLTVYDSRNRLVQTVNPDGTTTETQYDGDSRVIYTYDELGNLTSYAYNNLNQLISTTDPLGQMTTRTYDAVGNLLSVTDPIGQKTQYTYDLDNRQVAVVDLLGDKTTTTYDADGNVIKVTDPLGHSTTYSYDAQDRLITTTDALGNTTTNKYDTAGNLISVTDPDGNTTTYKYDKLNRKVSETDSAGGTQTYIYDSVGNLVSYTDADNRTTRYTYDSLNRRTSEQWLGSAGNSTYTISYAYDAAGELVAESDPDSSYTYTYDPLGRVLSVYNTGTPGAPFVALVYTRDADGNVTAIGAYITDATGTGQVTQSMSYNADGEETQVSLPGAGATSMLVNFTYNADGEIQTSAAYSDLAGTQTVVSSNYTYDAASRLTQLAYTHGGTTIAKYQWTYDAAGLITQESNADGTLNYSYDTTNQLVSASGSGLPANESYSYDANGNRTTAGSQTVTNNRLSTDGTYNYEYDADGNLILQTQIATGDTTAYTYDYRNRLTEVVYKNAAGTVLKEVDYTYDVNNNLISEKVTVPGSGASGTVVNRFLYQGNQVLFKYDGAGYETDHYLYGPGGQLLADEVFTDQGSTANVLWTLTDNQGTVRDVIDPSGAVQDHIQYDAFGQIVAQTNPADMPLFTYTGQMFDQATGLYYYRARFYDAAIGRFLSQDPISLSGGQMNLYEYVENNPVNLTDPTGMYVAQALEGSSNLTAQAVSAAGQNATLQDLLSAQPPQDQQVQSGIVQTVVSASTGAARNLGSALASTESSGSTSNTLAPTVTSNTATDQSSNGSDDSSGILRTGSQLVADTLQAKVTKTLLTSGEMGSAQQMLNRTLGTNLKGVSVLGGLYELSQDTKTLAATISPNSGQTSTLDKIGAGSKVVIDIASLVPGPVGILATTWQVSYDTTHYISKHTGLEQVVTNAFLKYWFHVDQ